MRNETEKVETEHSEGEKERSVSKTRTIFAKVRNVSKSSIIFEVLFVIIIK